jgi:Phage integrase, N-terminal SAM-like domain
MTSNENTPPRRVRVERNIYRRPSGVFEVGLKDLGGVQRWRTVNGGFLAARAVRDELLARRGKREATSADPRLRFTSAAGAWLDGPVRHLRESTQAGYRNAVDQHLLPRFAPHRLDAITADDLAELVRSMRAAGKSEATILVVLGVTGRIYKFAARRAGLGGNRPDEADALVRAPEGLPGEEATDLHGRADRCSV